MVKAAAEVDRYEAGAERDGGGQHRPAGGEPLCLDHSFRLDIGERRAHHLFDHLPPLERFQVAVGVHPSDILHRSGMWTDQLPPTHQPFVGQERQHHLPAQRIHRDGAEADHVARIVDEHEPGGAQAATYRTPDPPPHPPADRHEARLTHGIVAS